MSAVVRPLDFRRQATMIAFVYVTSLWLRSDLRGLGPGTWPPLILAREMANATIEFSYLLAGLALGMVCSVLGARCFLPPSRIRSPRQYVRNGLSTFSAVMGILVTLGAASALSSVFNLSGAWLALVTLTGTEMTSFVAWRRWRTRTPRCSCGADRSGPPASD